MTVKRGDQGDANCPGGSRQITTEAVRGYARLNVLVYVYKVKNVDFILSFQECECVFFFSVVIFFHLFSFLFFLFFF